MEKKATTSCGCAVIRYFDGVPHVLLVRPFAERDAWGIPKGHTDEGESFGDCALRETREEAGIEAILMKPLSSVKTSYKHEIKTVWGFIARQRDQNAKPAALDGENVDIRFFKLDELPNLHVYQRPLLDEVVKLVGEMKKEDFTLGNE